MASSTGALEGLRVLDIATLFSAPMLAAMLGDLGADVVKVEPPGGDGLRHLGRRGAGGASLTWASVGRNKRAVTLDLGSAGGQALFRRLVERADVLVENLPPSTLEKWRCTWEELSSLNPRLVMVSVSCYGRTGPYRDRPGNGTLAEAFGGLTHMTGEADGPPMLTSLALGDTLAAVSGVVGTLAACYHRDARGGGGQHVDVSMYEPVLQLLSTGALDDDAAAAAPHRAGSRIPGAVPRNVYRTGDGYWVAVSAATDRMVARLLHCIGRDDDEARERWGSVAGRLRDGDGLDAELARWLSGRSRQEAVEALLGARIPIAPVNDLEALLADPHVAARENWVRVDDPTLGSLRLLAPTPRLGRTPGRVRSTGPALGAHDREVYRDWLGLSDAEVEALRVETP